MKKKILSLTLVVCLLAIAVVGGTLAYFTDYTDTAVNTFTVGNVNIELDEAKVNEDGTLVKGDARVIKNDYKLFPGHTYNKDPMVTVKAKSENAYVRMLVTVSDMKALEKAFPANKYSQFYGEDGVFLLQMLCVDENNECTWAKEDWNYFDYANGVYEFRYKTTVGNATEEDVTLAPLFTKITVPSFLTNEEVIALNDLKISVVAQAIQADGLDTADAAWTAYGKQVDKVQQK